MEASFENTKKILEKQCRQLINSKLVEFQEITERSIATISIELEEVKPDILRIKNFNIHLK